MRMRRWVGMVAGMLAWPAIGFAIDPADLSLVRFPDANTEFAAPIGIRAPNDGTGRVFVIERCDGIRIVKNGQVLATPFVSVDASCGGEQGVLGLAFDPDFSSNGTFYVSYTAPSSDARIGESADQVIAR